MREPGENWVELEPADPARRKLFEKVLGLGFLGVTFVVAFPLVNVFTPPKRTSEKNELIEVGPEGSLAIGSSKDVMGADGVPIIVFNFEGELIALEKKCPHLGCMVELAGNELDCPCHGARFTTEGKLIKGPSPRGLKRYNVHVREGKIFVGGEMA